MERHAQSAQQVPESTLSVLVGAIAEQVAAQVKAELLAQSQGPAHVQPMLLNVKDAGVYLGRSEQSIQHLIFERELPVVRVGRRVHLDRRDLDAWIEKNKY
jgi:excisionase family DNA binding protein